MEMLKIVSFFKHIELVCWRPVGRQKIVGFLRALYIKNLCFLPSKNMFSPDFRYFRRKNREIPSASFLGRKISSRLPILAFFPPETVGASEH